MFGIIDQQLYVRVTREMQAFWSEYACQVHAKKRNCIYMYSANFFSSEQSSLIDQSQERPYAELDYLLTHNT